MSGVMKRKSYPRDLSNKQWAILESLILTALPDLHPSGGVSKSDTGIYPLRVRHINLSAVSLQ